MRVLLIDDHPLFRQALAATIGQIAADLAIGQCDTLAEAKATLVSGSAVSLILLDLKLPDSQGMGGLLSLKAEHPAIPVAIVSASDDGDTVQTAMACGAAGFVSKAAGVEELSAAIEALLAGEAWFPEPQAEARRTPLTPTQMRVLNGVHRGLMNKQIAFETGLSEATVKYHLTGLFRKFGVLTRAQLLALARERSSST
ncbi:response regulator transcription factor [Novosphingobium sp. FKTRR1]|uniref:response regulator transcription factor n=1 Tax=Novosphingobium sp. FKTRR1 TaxID=2879118 RepID=UPI001CF0D51B|nr:response regulator transcription factor [Novosphingobium sp. FKTRR1]